MIRVLLFETAIGDQVRHWEGIVRSAVEVPVNFGDTLLHSLQEVAERAETVLVLRAVSDTGEGDNGVVEDEADEGLLLGRLGRLGVDRGRAGHDLSVHVGGERRDRVDAVGLEKERGSMHDPSARKISYQPSWQGCGYRGEGRLPPCS